MRTFFLYRPDADLAVMSPQDDDAWVERQAEIIAALRATPLLGFGMSWFLSSPGAGMRERAGDADADAGDARPYVAVRADGRRWVLTTIEAACLALSLRLTPRFRGRDLFADALGAAVREAEDRLTALRDAA